MGIEEVQNNELTNLSGEEVDWATIEDWETLYKPTTTTFGMDLSKLTDAQYRAMYNRYMLDLLRYNLRNKCGDLDYNKYGCKKGNTFKPITNIFCDNFLLGIPVSLEFLSGDADDDDDEEDNSTGRKYTHMDDANIQVRKLLRRNGLPEADSGGSVKGVRISSY